MTMHHEFATRSTEASGFPDLLQFGLEALLYLPSAELPRIAHRIGEQGYVHKQAKAKQAALHVVLMVPTTLPNGISFPVQAELFFEPVDPERTRLTNRSSITLNGLRLLRHMIGIDDWPAGLDGKDNVVGPTSGHAAGRVDQLLFTIGDVVEQVIEAIEAIMPEQYAIEEEFMRLRKAELTHDVACPDPISVVRDLAQSSFRGAIASMADVYRQSAHSSRGIPVVKWKLTESGVYLKVYGKTGGLLRHEVSCLSRDSVVAVTGRDWDGIAGQTAVELTRSFIDGASPLLADLLHHVEEVGSGLIDPAALVIEFRPIVELMLRGNKWSPKAGAVWNALVLTAEFDAKGERKGTVLRDVLENLTGPDGPLQHGARPTIYHLHPRLVQRAGG